MPSSTVSPVTGAATVPANTTAVTKSKEQILIQSSGAMIAVIVIGIIIILAVLLISLKTYNRRTHASRVLGVNGSSKPRPRTSQSTVHGNVPLTTMPVNSASGSPSTSTPASENSFQLPRAELNSVDGNNMEQLSTASGSTVVTIHDVPLAGNT